MPQPRPVKGLLPMHWIIPLASHGAFNQPQDVGPAWDSEDSAVPSIFSLPTVVPRRLYKCPSLSRRSWISEAITRPLRGWDASPWGSFGASSRRRFSRRGDLVFARFAVGWRQKDALRIGFLSFGWTLGSVVDGCGQLYQNHSGTLNGKCR